MIAVPGPLAFPLWRWLFWQSEYSQGLRQSQWWGYEEVAVEGYVRARFKLEPEGRLPDEVEKFYVEFLAFMRKVQAANAVLTKRRLGILPQKRNRKKAATPPTPKPPVPEHIQRLAKRVIWWYGRYWHSEWRFKDTPDIVRAALLSYSQQNPDAFEVEYPLVIIAIRRHFNIRAAEEREKDALRKLRAAKREEEAARQTKLFERTDHR